MTQQKEKLCLVVFILSMYACGPREDNDAGSQLAGNVTFEFLDSVVVASLSELYLSDKDPDTDRLLLNDWEMNELFITDLKGEIISQIKPRGEGPHQVQAPLELAFWKDGILIKEISAGQHFHFFNGNFEKTAKGPALADGITVIGMPNSGKSFSVMEKNGKPLIVGYEYNAIDAQLWASEEQHIGFYEKAEMGYLYEPNSTNVVNFSLYPETWTPRLEGKWVGTAYPRVQVSKTDQVVAVLPSFGNQLFYYTLDGNGLQPLEEIELVHPERNEKIPFDVDNDDGILYPFFNRLHGGGKYFLIEFNTAFPRELYNSFRAKGENFRMDPEYWEAQDKHSQTKYILTDIQGNQAAISELPVPGAIHLMDADDILYIKPTTEIELDYNVFYRYQVSLE